MVGQFVIIMTNVKIILMFRYFVFPGWCGEIRDVIFSENGSVTVVYRVNIKGSDGEVQFLP